MIKKQPRMNKKHPRCRIFLFYILTGLGLSRCLNDIFFYPNLTRWGAWLIPRPQVFVDRHYLLNKKIIIQNQNDQVLEYDLSSEDQWPLKNSLLIFSYTLVHCLDRPHLMDKDIWEKTIKFYFCKENNSVLKYEITSSPIKMVTAYVGKSKQSMQLVREVKCLN